MIRVPYHISLIIDAVQIKKCHAHSKYKFMESSCERTKLNLKSKIPDIEKTLELVRVLQEKQVRRARTAWQS